MIHTALFSALLLSIPLLGCVARTHNESDVRKVAANNDFVSVVTTPVFNVPRKYRPLIDAFGMLDMGCTATHIGGGLAVTAGHCFSAGEERSEADCTSTVKWGYRKDTEPYLTSRCTKILAMQHGGGRDYAIFLVDPAPSASVKVDLEKAAKPGDTITIFGHPEGRPLEWGHTCSVSPVSAAASVLPDLEESMFVHRCDTLPGNSGSTVLNDATLEVVGIHDGGRVSRVNGRPETWNYSTFIRETPLSEILKQRAAE